MNFIWTYYQDEVWGSDHDREEVYWGLLPEKRRIRRQDTNAKNLCLVVKIWETRSWCWNIFLCTTSISSHALLYNNWCDFLAAKRNKPKQSLENVSFAELSWWSSLWRIVHSSSLPGELNKSNQRKLWFCQKMFWTEGVSFMINNGLITDQKTDIIKSIL